MGVMELGLLTKWTRAVKLFAEAMDSKELWCYREGPTVHPRPIVPTASVGRCLWRFVLASWVLCLLGRWSRGIGQTPAATTNGKYLNVKQSFSHAYASHPLTGVMHAKTNRGAADSPSSHLQPRFGATARASATSKHAPSAQKHYKSQK